MEVDCILVTGFIAKSSATYFEHFDPTVDAFRTAVCDLQYDGIYNTPKMRFDEFGDVFNRFQSASKRPR